MYDSIQQWLESLKTYCLRSEIRKRNRQIIAVAILVIVAFLGKSWLSPNSIGYDDKRHVVTLDREALGEGSISLTVRAEKDGTIVTEDVILSFPEETESAENVPSNASATEDLSLKEAIRTTISDIKASDGKTVVLPQRTKDGVTLQWEKTSDYTVLYLIFLPLCIIFLGFWEEQRKPLQFQKNYAESVAKDLPSFQSELLILLSSGMIMMDAIVRIAQGYESGNHKPGEFRHVIVSIGRELQTHRRGMIPILSEWERKVPSRDFVRLCRIIKENQTKGVSIVERLEQERIQMWEKRRTLAEERGKRAETKLSLPLALLLIVLLIITAAPAFLQMNGG